MSTQPMRPGLRASLSLEYPMSLGVYDSYDEAQRAVDYLSDHEFPVKDVLIVGTDLKQLERVTGRLTRGRAIGGGALSGAWLGLFIGTDLRAVRAGWVQPAQRRWRRWPSGLFGVVWTAVGLPVTSGGQRDFTSVSLVVAAKYEVLCEHKHAHRGREMLARDGPDAGGRAGAAAGPRGRAGPPAAGPAAAAATVLAAAAGLTSTRVRGRP